MNLSNRSSRRLKAVCVALSLVSLGACQKSDVSDRTSRLAPMAAMAGGQALMATESAPVRQDKMLAYEHTLNIELSRELLPTRLREIEEACSNNPTLGCTLLESSVTSYQDVPSGTIRLRLAAGGIESIVALAGKDGTVIGRTTHSEDLAEPVADTERQLALLTTHRDRLVQFMNDKSLKVDQLITVSKELATTQTQIDSFATQRANLRRRIDTELLTITLSLPTEQMNAARRPVMDALRDFGSDFTAAIGHVITFIAVLVPWLIVIVPGLFALSYLWRRMRRWHARRDSL